MLVHFWDYIFRTWITVQFGVESGDQVGTFDIYKKKVVNNLKAFKTCLTTLEAGTREPQERLEAATVQCSPT